MTIEIEKSRLLQGKREKIIFESADVARRALESDPLGTLYRDAKGVYVVTSYGSGRFTKEEWERSE